MIEDFTIRELSLIFPHDRNTLIHFLQSHSLTFEDDIETAFGIFDFGETLVGCGCCAENLLKCFAVNQSLRGQNALGSLVSRLVENRFEQGYYDLFIITHPHNKELFTACGFYPLAETNKILMMENRKKGLEHFYSPFLTNHVEQSDVGCIVMNCNPFTKGHLALITFGAAHCSLLHIFVVEENKSIFPFDVRIRLVKEGTANFPNVHVHPSGPYMISSSTFPTYFLKKGEDVARIQSELDITLFVSKIAPLFHIEKRFAGDEPFDSVTRQYNETMEVILPQHKIAFIKIPRISTENKSGENEIISASLVRKLLAKDGVTSEVLELVPPCTANYLKNEFGGF